MILLIETVCNYRDDCVGNVFKFDTEQEAQNKMNEITAVEEDAAMEFWKDCGSHKRDKPYIQRTPYYVKIKTPYEVKNYSIMKV